MTTNKQQIINGFNSDGIAKVATPAILADMLRENRREYGSRSNWTPETVTVTAAAIVTVNGEAYAAETVGSALAFVSALINEPSIFSKKHVARKYTIAVL